MININLTISQENKYTSVLTTSVPQNYANLVKIDKSKNDYVLVIENNSAYILPENWQVTSVIANGQALMPSSNPSFPQSGEYLHNPYANTIQVYGVSIPSLQIYGTQEEIKYVPPLLQPPYPALFTNLPLEGTIQLNRSFEQHPSAQFELESTLSKGFLQQIFAPGGELDLYGLPLRISSISITELPRSIYPDARCKISVFLGGKWENRLEEPVFLRSDGTNNLPTDTPFQDPDCQVGAANNPNNKDSVTTIAALFAKTGITLVSPALSEVTIDKNTPRDATVNPAQLLQERVRIANSFVRWSRTGFVEVVPITGLKTWTYAETEILGEVETNYDAIDKSSKRQVFIANLNPALPDLVNFPSTVQLPPTPILRAESPTNLGFEYPNVELSGEFLNPSEKVEEKFQGISTPRYVRKPSKKEERVEGDKNAHEPLEGVNTIKAMSLCFDIGGKTKTRTTITEVAGTKIFEDLEIWGFAYIAEAITNDATGKLAGNPNDLWQCLKKVRTEYIYDPETGYLLYVTEDGYNTVRYKQESADNPETLQLPSSGEEYGLYKFFRVPVISRTSYRLRLMPEYSNDDLFEVVKVCDRDGTSHYEPLINPDYAPPYYAEFERTESTAFASRSNPDNKGLNPSKGDKLLPDLIVGEESEFGSITNITKATYGIIFDSRYPGVRIRGEQISPQKFSKYVKKFKAEGQAIANSLSEVSLEEGTGDPPVAPRRSPQYQREEKSIPRSSDTSDDNKPKYRYLIQTAGYSASDPVGGSESFSAAKTLQEALTAARCKLAIENWRTGLTETLQIPGNLSIAEGDRFNYYCNGEFRQRVVLSVQHTLNILGVVDGTPKITAITSLTLGRYFIPTMTYSAIKLPQEPKPPGYKITVVNVIREALGGIIDWGLIKSRRNF